MSRRPTAHLELTLGRAGLVLRTPAGTLHAPLGAAHAPSGAALALSGAVDVPSGAAPSQPGAAHAPAALGMPGLAGALESSLAPLLEQGLAAAGPAPRGGWRAGVVLDDAWCWLDVVHGDFAARSAQALHWMVHACAQEVFAEAVDAQTLRWQVQADGRHALLLAVDAALVAALQDTLRRYRVVLDSLQPAFALAWNAARAEPGFKDGLVAWLHEGQAVLVHLRAGSMVALAREAVQASAAALDQAARRLLARYGDVLGGATRRLLLTAAQLEAASLAPWQIERIAARALPPGGMA